MANIFAQRRIIGQHLLHTASFPQMQIIFHAKLIAIMELPPGDFCPNPPYSSSVKANNGRTCIKCWYEYCNNQA